MNTMQSTEQSTQEKNRNRNSAQTTITGKNLEPMIQTSCNQSTTPSASSPNRLIAQSPSHNALHTISQPYLGDSSNFGPFYHHHSHHHHLPSYGNPYEKYKSTTNIHHARSPNASPYDPYQGFYTPTSHHHQIVRPNGYIDLVPR